MLMPTKDHQHGSDEQLGVDVSLIEPIQVAVHALEQLKQRAVGVRQVLSAQHYLQLATLNQDAQQRNAHVQLIAEEIERLSRGQNSVEAASCFDSVSS